MAFSFPKLSWLWSSKRKNKKVSNGSLEDSFGIEEESINMMKNPNSKSRLNRKSKRKWKGSSMEERVVKVVDKEYDVVLVPSDGVSLSGSDSDDSDWSVGWLEPHGPGFKGDHEADDSFAVLVPCYRNNLQEMLQGRRKDEESPFFRGHNGPSNGLNEYMEQWLSSLKKY